MLNLKASKKLNTEYVQIHIATFILDCGLLGYEAISPCEWVTNVLEEPITTIFRV
jgi:hypothetical protein